MEQSTLLGRKKMRFHHMCIVTADIDEAIHLWRDVMGFELKVKLTDPGWRRVPPNYYGASKAAGGSL
jgi:catechol 2,3-dioxygenase-like lactoylglutathione lyase family enzyme